MPISMATILLPLFVCFLGAAVALIPNRAQTLGVYAFAVGLWWTLAEASHHVVRLL